MNRAQIRAGRAIMFAAVLTFLLASGVLAGPAEAKPDQPPRRLAYMAVGDSISEGVGTSDWVNYPDGTFERVSYTHEYAERAGVRVTAVGGACAGTWCGERSIRAWLPPALAALHRPPSVVITHLGINDLVVGVSAEQIVTDLRQVRRQLRGLGVRLVFGTIGPSPAGNETWAASQEQRLLVNDWIRGQRTFVDYAGALEGPDRFLRPEFVGHFADVHVGDLGAKVMGRLLRAWVEQDVARHGGH